MVLNSRVTILQRPPGSDANGEPSTAWPVLTTVFGRVLHLSGAEAVRAETIVSTVRASIKVNRRADITADMRAETGGRLYDIKAVLPDEVGRRHMFLVCESVP